MARGVGATQTVVHRSWRQGDPRAHNGMEVIVSRRAFEVRGKPPADVMIAVHPTILILRPLSGTPSLPRLCSRVSARKAHHPTRPGTFSRVPARQVREARALPSICLFPGREFSHTRRRLEHP